MYFAENIKLLRKRRGRTQDDLAAVLGMKRSTLSGYENKVAQPGIAALLEFSNYFNVAIDTLVRVDLASLNEHDLLQLERGFDVFIKGSGLRVLTSTVDSNNDKNIELVPEKAKEDYTTGYASPEFINRLEVYQLPFLSRTKKYRTFQVSGDSMLPMPDGCWVTGEFLKDWTLVKSGDFCLILTLDDGIVFKMVENRLEKEQELVLHSLNPVYEPYHVKAENIREIWKFVHCINSEIPESGGANSVILKTMAEIKSDLRLMKNQMGLKN